MTKIMLVVGFSMLLSSLAGAHGRKGPLVNIENADKVIVKGGSMSLGHKLRIMNCLRMVKKHKTADAALEAKSAMLKEKCEKHNIDADKCEAKKRRMERRINRCFKIHNFMQDHLKASDSK